MNFGGSSAVTNVSNLKMYNVTYCPSYGSIQEFGYFEYVTMVDSLIVENVQIKDFDSECFIYTRYYTDITVQAIQVVFPYFV